jgi:hypothetical protein
MVGTRKEVWWYSEESVMIKREGCVVVKCEGCVVVKCEGCVVVKCKVCGGRVCVVVVCQEKRFLTLGRQYIYFMVICSRAKFCKYCYHIIPLWPHDALVQQQAACIHYWIS